jgi:hypothetical protein
MLPTSFGKKIPPGPWYHFSIDDVFDSLIELTDKGIPLFDHSFFRMLKEAHDRFGTYVDLELFWQREIDGTLRTLEEVRSLKEELENEGGWIKFGPHALDYATAPFEQSPAEQRDVFDNIYHEIERIAGKEYCAEWIRLHFYSESYELADYFKERGVTALFSTDRPIGAHRLPPEAGGDLYAKGIAKYGDMNFIRTQFRVEYFTNKRCTKEDLRALFQDAINKYGYITVYSHEYEFARSEVRSMLRIMLEALGDLGVQSIR